MGYLKYNDSDFEDYIFNSNNNDDEEKNENKKDSKLSLNTILYGPPGTGKTYHTINRAIEILNFIQSIKMIENL